MSDYLWDKSGEADAETERLEDLLGQLRFQPTPFDLPAELPARDFRAARARRSLLSWPRLAVAASITLALLAGAWLALKQQTAATNDAPQLVKQDDRPAAPPSTAAMASDPVGETADVGDDQRDETPPVAPPRVGEPPRRQLVAVPHRPRVPDLAGNKSRRAPRVNRTESAGARKVRDVLTPSPVNSGRREETAQLAAEREAAEKVLYALRVTSEKLSYARQQVREAARGEANR